MSDDLIDAPSLDFNSATLARRTAAEAVVDAIDAGLRQRHDDEPRRRYLGASFLGDPCARSVQYQSQATAYDADKGHPPHLLRIFERGHVMEEMAVGWLRHAGFVLKTQGKDGRQFGFEAAGGEFRGHADGVLVGWAGPGEAPIQMPALWEHKALGSKSWKEVVRNGVRKAKPTFHAQMMIYQYQLQLTENPAVFMATNADDLSIHVELVPFDAQACQELVDKAVRIIRANAAGELVPRGADNPDAFTCRFCRFHRRCWST